MIAPAELASALDRHDVLRLFDHADRVIAATWIGAHAAQLVFGDVAAHGAETHLRLDRCNRLGKARDVRAICGEEVERDALGALGPNAGESPQLVDQILHRAVIHRVQRRLPVPQRGAGASGPRLRRREEVGSGGGRRE